MTDKEDAPLRTQDVKAVLVAKHRYVKPLSGIANQAAENFQTPSPKVTLSGSRPTKGMATKKEYQRQVMKAPTKEVKHIIQGEISNPRNQQKANQAPFKARSNLVSKWAGNFDGET